MFPSEVLKSVAIYHLPSTGSKVYPGSASATVTGAFLPLDRKDHALEGGAFTNPHELYVSPSVDIRESDKVIVDDVTYFVKQTGNVAIGGLAHIRVTLSTE